MLYWSWAADPEFTIAALLHELARRIDTGLSVDSAYHKNTDAPGRKGSMARWPGSHAAGLRQWPRDAWGAWLPCAVFFAVNQAASTLGGDLTPFSIAWGQHPRLPLSLPELRTAGEPARLG